MTLIEMVWALDRMTRAATTLVFLHLKHVLADNKGCTSQNPKQHTGTKRRARQASSFPNSVLSVK